MPRKMCAIIRVVVVLPFEPVTATIGIRAGVPGGNSRSTTGFATYCGSPSVGCVCIRNPGAAFTSTIAPPVSRTGLRDVGREEVDPRDVEPDDARGLLGDLHVVLVRLPRPVDRDAAGGHVARGRELDHLALRRHVVEREPCFFTRSLASSSILIRVRTFSWPMPAARVLVRDLDELGDRVLAVADDVRGDPLATATIRPPITSTR